MSSTSPMSSLAKLGLVSRPKPVRIMVLGQGGVGKTAMVVRFITRRFIGEYDPNLEKIYTFHTEINTEKVYFDILDTAGQNHEKEFFTLETNIKWADAFVLVYSVTDKCSFDECNRLKFLINYNKRRKSLRSSSSKNYSADVPVVLVGNKTDQAGDRMVSTEEGQKRSKEIGCVCFHEISVRESIDQVWAVFRDVWHFWKLHSKYPKLRRFPSDGQNVSNIMNPDNAVQDGSFRKLQNTIMLGRRWAESDLEEEDEDEQKCESTGSVTPVISGGHSLDIPFRNRASTDGHLLSKPRKWKYPSSNNGVTSFPSMADRRMSISMRGSNTSY